MSRDITPEKFVQAASLFGFTIQTSATQLCLRSQVPLAEEAMLSVAETRGISLLNRVPLFMEGWWRDAGKVTIERRQEKFYTILDLLQPHPDLTFRDQVLHLAKNPNQGAERRQALGTLFDEKVIAEIEADPQLLDMQLQVEVTQSNLVAQKLAIEARRETLLLERQEFRQPFLYVTDDKAL